MTRQFLNKTFYNASDFEKEKNFKKHGVEEENFLKSTILKKKVILKSMILKKNNLLKSMILKKNIFLKSMISKKNKFLKSMILKKICRQKITFRCNLARKMRKFCVLRAYLKSMILREKKL